MPLQRLRRDRRLTPGEAAKYNSIRAQVDADRSVLLQQLNAEEAIRILLAELRTAREQAGLSLADIHDRTGMDRSALSKLETGGRDNPTLQTLIRYADALGKSLLVQVVDKS
jgi:DNA-binding XRE family transcriptional regulator